MSAIIHLMERVTKYLAMQQGRNNGTEYIKHLAERLSNDVIREIARKYKNVLKGRKRFSGPLHRADRSEA